MVNFEIMDRWDERLKGRDGENESIARINYYYNF